ncbi:MAG: ribonuclease P protein component 2 [Candidatus Aenigmarchaeota archaeon]|nr:ribonuclease P protein component 2 [Candidatus Aenigmarchaeota archaeon]
MKRLKSPPALRAKKRYIIFRVHSDDPEFRPDFLNIRGAIWNSLEGWLGEAGLAKADVKFIMNLWDSRKQTGFLSCSPKFVDQVKVALALVHQVGDERVILQVLRVSGTIKGGKEKVRS